MGEREFFRGNAKARAQYRAIRRIIDGLGDMETRFSKAVARDMMDRARKRGVEKMRTFLLLLATSATLTACGPSASELETPSAPVAEPCNSLQPNLAVPVRMRGEATSSSELPALAGGAMEGGVYDLASGAQFDGAPSWEDERYVSVEVTNSHEGIVLDWAEQSGEGVTRWSAAVSTSPASLMFTCGRSGDVPISYNSSAAELHLRMPDPSGTGVLDLVFVRRG